MPARFYRNRRAVLGRSNANPSENYVRGIHWATGTGTGIVQVYLATILIEDWLIPTVGGPSGDTVLKAVAPQSTQMFGQLNVVLHSGAAPADGINMLIAPNIRAARGEGGELFAATVVRLNVGATIVEDPTETTLKSALSNTSAADATSEPGAPPRTWGEWERAVADDAKPPDSGIRIEPKSKLHIVKRKRRRR